LTWEGRDGILTHTGNKDPATLEGQIVKIADRIAYINHDIDDAIRAGILSAAELPSDLVNIFGKYQSTRINTMVNDLVEASQDKDKIQMSEKIAAATDALRDFMFERVYLNPVAKSESSKAKGILKALFEYYLEHPEELPAEFRRTEEDLKIKVCDYLAGMTDQYAVRTFDSLFVPKAWMV